MTGPALVAQGTINRLIGSVVVTDTPALNVTASYLGKEGISFSFKGPATTRLGTMTGGVPSQEPYREAILKIHLVKSQALAGTWQTQELTNSQLGSITVYPDAVGLPPFQLDNCSLDGLDTMVINGMDAGYVITIGGYYYVNSTAWG